MTCGADLNAREDNKRNLQYFEHTTMRGLYECIESWQAANRKRFQSLDIQRDGDLFCCITLTNPTEVTIVGSRSLTPSGNSTTPSRVGCLVTRRHAGTEVS
jgi:hypothetical protein